MAYLFLVRSMSALRRLFSRRSLLIFGVCYAVVWLLTATVGERQTKRTVLGGRMPCDEPFVEIAPEYDRYVPHSAWYSFRAVSYAPFVVAVKWRFHCGDFGTGGSGIVLWIGKVVYFLPFDAWIT